MWETEECGLGWGGCGGASLAPPAHVPTFLCFDRGGFQKSMVTVRFSIKLTRIPTAMLAPYGGI